MDITFSTAELQSICEESRLATRRLGHASARKLQARLADVLAAANCSELVAGRPHVLKGDRHGQLALDLAGAARLVLAVANNPIPQNDDGSIAWEEVSRVQVVFIGDYHD